MTNLSTLIAANGQLIQALSRLVTACELEQQWPSDDAKPALLAAVAEGRAVLQEVVQGAADVPACVTEQDCEGMPWCRIDGKCLRSRRAAPAAAEV